MEVKQMVPPPMVMHAPAPMPAPVPHHDGHVHLHASYKHTQIVAPVHHAPVAVAPVVAPYNSDFILVLFILLVIITRSFFHGYKC